MITTFSTLIRQGRFVLTTAKPYYLILRNSLAITVLAFSLTACGSGKWGFPYRPDVQQGNWITSEQVAQLQPGMSREQVRYILGTPTLQNVFRTDRWDYPYYNKPGYGSAQQREFTVWFDDDTLTRWSGDDQPDRQPFEKADTGMDETSPRLDTGESEPTDASLPMPGQPELLR